MKKFIFAICLCSLAVQAFAAESPWTTSVPDAEKQAQKEHKLVLLDFTGSDWCPPCRELETETFSKSEFLNYAKTNLVLVQVDFPANKPQTKALKDANDQLQMTYKVDGYPTIIVLKPDGHVLWQNVGFISGGPKALIEMIEAARAKEKI